MLTSTIIWNVQYKNLFAHIILYYLLGQTFLYVFLEYVQSLLCWCIVEFWQMQTGVSPTPQDKAVLLPLKCSCTNQSNLLSMPNLFLECSIMQSYSTQPLTMAVLFSITQLRVTCVAVSVVHSFYCWGVLHCMDVLWFWLLAPHLGDMSSF